MTLPNSPLCVTHHYIQRTEGLERKRTVPEIWSKTFGLSAPSSFPPDPTGLWSFLFSGVCNFAEILVHDSEPLDGPLVQVPYGRATGPVDAEAYRGAKSEVLGRALILRNPESSRTCLVGRRRRNPPDDGRQIREYTVMFDVPSSFCGYTC